MVFANGLMVLGTVVAVLSVIHLVKQFCMMLLQRR